MAHYTGVLCHITSLPSGTLDDAEKFIEILADSGATVWQILPITPPDEHGSPYASPSAFAADSSLGQSKPVSMESEEYWLNDWLLFEEIKRLQNGTPWTDWPVELRDRDPHALAKIKIDSSKQASFMGRWFEIRDFSDSKGVSLIGDLPFFVAHDSAEVWAHRELFLLEENGLPSVVAGVPPDYFSKDGQRWGTVLYNWPAHKEEKWLWWSERMKRMMRLFDIVRIDHFRGFHSAWAIPTQEKTARNGEWLEGPKDELIEVLIQAAGSHKCIIAEDLGIIPKEIVEMRKRHHLEGMSVLHFGFDDENADNPHRPENIVFDQVVYTGTHDNDTTVGWWNDSTPQRRARVKKFAKSGESICQTMIRLAIESPAGMAIIPLQDIMELGTDARMNTPGTAHGNWKWRFEWEALQKFSLK